MAVFNEPAQWTHPLGNNADVSTLPDDTPGTTGLASLQKLFQIINQTPLEAGGIAPEREDFNALFKILGDYIYYTMNGGVPSYNAAYDYVPGRVVIYTDGNIYKCIQANGASSTVVAPDETTPNVGADYWKQLDGEDDSTSLIPNQIIESPMPLTDANLHLLDGALLSGSGAYAEYVTMMGALHDADPTANIWTDEATWQASVTNTGSCGKFVYDSVNNTLRLPKIDGRYLKSTLSASDLGDLVNAQAPNITGDTGAGFCVAGGSGVSSGALSIKSEYIYQPSTGGGSSQSIQLNASDSNPIYSDSATTIDTDAVKVYYYIVLGTVSKTQIQIDIDNVMADLANKADKDFSNVSAPVQAFKDMSVEWGVPDFSAKITQSFNTNYTASSNGFILIYVRGINGVTGTATINGVSQEFVYDGNPTHANSSSLLIPIAKNSSYTIAISGGTLTNTSYVSFIPCKGAN